MSGKPKPGDHDYCTACRGQGIYVKWKDPDEEGVCIDCDGTGRLPAEGNTMNTKAMSHSTDPQTSHDAAGKVDAHVTAQIKQALLALLSEDRRTADELTDAYIDQADDRGWPVLSQEHNVKRRLSELHARHHVIRPSEERRPSRSGTASTVWELSVPLEEAREIVAGA